MQIRVRNGRVEYLRPWYDQAAKRTRQKLIKPSEFTDEERKEADAYHSKQREEEGQAHAEWAAKTAHERLEQIASGIEAGAMPADEEAMWSALGRLRRAMRKAGMRQPRKVDEVPETLTGKLNLE